MRSSLRLLTHYGLPRPAAAEPVLLEYRVTTIQDGGSYHVPASYWGGGDGEPYYWQDIGGTEMYSNFRFTGVEIPQGATILDARLSLWARGTFTGNPDKWNDVGLEQVDNASRPTSGANFASRMHNVGGVIRWPFAAASHGQPMTSPNLSSILQAHVNRPGWQSGNALQFFTATDTNDVATGWPFSPQGESVGSNSDPATHPRLEVEFIP